MVWQNAPWAPATREALDYSAQARARQTAAIRPCPCAACPARRTDSAVPPAPRRSRHPRPTGCTGSGQTSCRGATGSSISSSSSTRAQQVEIAAERQHVFFGVFVFGGRRGFVGHKAEPAIDRAAARRPGRGSAGRPSAARSRPSGAARARWLHVPGIARCSPRACPGDGGVSSRRRARFRQQAPDSAQRIVAPTGRAAASAKAAHVEPVGIKRSFHEWQSKSIAPDNRRPMPPPADPRLDFALPPRTAVAPAAARSKSHAPDVDETPLAGEAPARAGASGWRWPRRRRWRSAVSARRW